MMKEYTLMLLWLRRRDQTLLSSSTGSSCQCTGNVKVRGACKVHQESVVSQIQSEKTSVGSSRDKLFGKDKGNSSEKNKNDWSIRLLKNRQD